DRGPVRRVAGPEQLGQPEDRRAVAEGGTGRLRGEPAQDPAAAGGAEASPEHGVDRVEAAAPAVAVEQARKLAGEPGEVGEPGAVDDQHRKVAVAGHGA